MADTQSIYKAAQDQDADKIQKLVDGCRRENGSHFTLHPTPIEEYNLKNALDCIFDNGDIKSFNAISPVLTYNLDMVKSTNIVDNFLNSDKICTLGKNEITDNQRHILHSVVDKCGQTDLKICAAINFHFNDFIDPILEKNHNSEKTIEKSLLTAVDNDNLNAVQKIINHPGCQKTLHDNRIRVTSPRYGDDQTTEEKTLKNSIYKDNGVIFDEVFDQFFKGKNNGIINASMKFAVNIKCNINTESNMVDHLLNKFEDHQFSNSILTHPIDNDNHDVLKKILPRIEEPQHAYTLYAAEKSDNIETLKCFDGYASDDDHKKALLVSAKNGNHNTTHYLLNKIPEQDRDIVKVAQEAMYGNKFDLVKELSGDFDDKTAMDVFSNYQFGTDNRTFSSNKQDAIYSVANDQNIQSLAKDYYQDLLVASIEKNDVSMVEKLDSHQTYKKNKIELSFMGNDKNDGLQLSIRKNKPECAAVFMKHYSGQEINTIIEEKKLEVEKWPSLYAYVANEEKKEILKALEPTIEKRSVPKNPASDKNRKIEPKPFKAPSRDREHFM